MPQRIRNLIVKEWSPVPKTCVYQLYYKFFVSLLLGYGKVRTFVKLQIRVIMKKSIKRLPKRTQEKLTVLLDL